MVKIYFDTRALILAGKDEDPDASHEGYETTFATGKEISVQDVWTDHKRYPLGLLCWTSDADALLNEIKQQLLVLPAAGGFVYTKDKNVLLIFRRGKWDLPKGKLDAGESLAECALREVEEETGLAGAQIGQSLPTTYHIYKEKERLVLKESYWYMMLSDTTLPLAPQTEEDIEECRWVHANDLHKYYSNAQPSIIDILKEGSVRLEGQ
ncbi:MAG: NUDIX domain-containing protein [Chitinophagaceae bacterium]